MERERNTEEDRKPENSEFMQQEINRAQRGVWLQTELGCRVD